LAGDPHADLDNAIADVDRIRTYLGKTKDRQVRKGEDRDFLKATAWSWFRTRRLSIAEVLARDVLAAIDAPYQVILDGADKHSSKQTYVNAAKAAKIALLAARKAMLVAPSPAPTANEAPPNFSPLASDVVMQTILSRRWNECQICLGAGAPLATVVMMGGLLEALFVARANRLSDKSVLFKAAGAPLDKQTKKPLALQNWMLASYIAVGHELQWISKSGKDVAGVLREYRNYIHPEKERSHGVVLEIDDARMLWEVTKTLSRELLALKGKV
jgi:hypothetical protein